MLPQLWLLLVINIWGMPVPDVVVLGAFPNEDECLVMKHEAQERSNAYLFTCIAPRNY